MKSLLAAVAVALLLVGCSSAGRFTTHGSLTLTSEAIRGANGAPTSDTPCSGTDGVSDLTAGAQVKVSDASGTTIALGQLDPGKYHRGACTFTFTVLDTPGRQDIYGLTVGERDEHQFTHDQMQNGPLLNVSYTRSFSQF